MAALLHRTDLYRHALPACAVAGLDLDIRWFHYARRRPRLVAVWQSGPDGRPACTWALAERDGSASADPSG